MKTRNIALIPFLVFLLVPLTGFAAIPSNTVWQVQNGGSDTNGGAIVSGTSTDYSLFPNKNSSGCTSCGSSTVDLSITDATATTTAIITSSGGTANFSTAIVGQIVYLTIGTGTCTSGTVNAQWRQVLSRQSASQITLDTTPTGSPNGCTGVTLNIGGALASPGQCSASGVSGNVCYVKYNATPYSITSVSAGQGGPLATSAIMMFQGYDTNRTLGNTDANRPTFQANVASLTMSSMTGNGQANNIIFDGNSGGGFTTKASTGGLFHRCKFMNMSTATTGTSSLFEYSESTTNGATVFVGSCLYCSAHGNSASPISLSTNNVCDHCLSYANSGATTDGIIVNGSNAIVINSISYGNGRYGFIDNSGSAGIFINDHAEANVGAGFNLSQQNKNLINCSAYNNSPNTTLSGTVMNIGFITVTAGSVFTNAAGGVFTLNNTTNQGALLRAAAFPALSIDGLTASYADIGAAQHQDTGTSAATPVCSIVGSLRISPEFRNRFSGIENLLSALN